MVKNCTNADKPGQKENQITKKGSPEDNLTVIGERSHFGPKAMRFC